MHSTYALTFVPFVRGWEIVGDGAIPVSGSVIVVVVVVVVASVAGSSAIVVLVTGTILLLLFFDGTDNDCVLAVTWIKDQKN